MTQTAAVLAHLTDVVGEDAIVTDGHARRGFSRDFSWLSPILDRDLPATTADVVVRPASTDQIPGVLRVAAEHRLPVTPRGKGTGNYGQAVPLAGGMVLDLSRCRQVLAVDGDTVSIEAGVTFQQLESALEPYGRELAVYPSMLSSTVGGFLSGGNQGLGSIEFGAIWDGWVRSLTVVPCTTDAVPTEVAGDELRAHLHAYGTTGVVSRVRMLTAERRQRTALFAAFDGLAAATAAGRALMDLPVPPRAVSIDDRAVYETFPAVPGMTGTVLLRAILDVRTVAMAEDFVAAHGGRVTAIDAGAVPAVQSSVYNHSTLRVRQADPSVCAVQIRGAAIVEREDDVRGSLPDVRIHLDGNAPRLFGKGFSGLLFSTWVDDATLELGMQRLGDLGVRVVNPHTWLVGSHGSVDEHLAAAERFDPWGLLNPGKLLRPPAGERVVS